jgi:hypothetical protein
MKRGNALNNFRGAARRSRVTASATVPAPVGGLNAKDALANMKPTDAIILDNFVPGTASVDLRAGYVSQATNFSAVTETLASYRTTATQKLFAVNGGTIWDVSSKYAKTQVATGYSNSRFQTANFGTVGGQFLVMVNGADKAVLYDGSAFRPLGDGAGKTIASITHSSVTATLTTTTPHGLLTGDTVTVVGAAPADYDVTNAIITVTSPTSFTYLMLTDPVSNATTLGSYTYDPSVQGVDTALFKDVQVYGRRLWFTEKNSFRVWYLGLESIAGTATSIDFGPLFILGGSLQGMVVWTVTGQLGTTSYAVFVSSEGECLLYQGYDPDDPTNFTLAGSFRIGKPIGQRFWERVGTDTVMITQDGLMPLSKAAIDNRQEQSDAISYKIINLINTDIAAYGTQFGWDLILFPLGNKIICNAPRPSSSDTVQYVMNTITSQWCRYTGLPAYCWALFDDQVYFGSDTAVFLAETGADDNGQPIQSDLQTAYNYFGKAGQQKLFTTVRPVITADNALKLSIGISTDFSAMLPTSQPTLSLAQLGSAWNVSPWNTSSWGPTERTSTEWEWASGLGFAASLRMRSLSKGITASFQSITYNYELSSGIY